MGAFKYTFKILIFIILITFITDKLVYSSLNYISDNVYTGQSIGKLNQYLSIKDTLNLIIFGSSRANHNINPSIIDKNSYNMGMDGRMIAFSGTLIKLLPKKKKQIILLHIDPSNAFKDDYTGFDVDALQVKYNRNKIIKNEIDKLKQNNEFQIYLWSISYNSKVLGILKNYLKPKYDYKKYNGFDPIYPTEIQREIFKKKLLQKKKKICNNDLILNQIYSKYLDEIKYFCNENNKDLIIFTSPIYNDECKNDNEKFKELMIKKNIKYYDYSDYFKNNNKLEYWKDETHLSSKGARIFTNEIKMTTKPNKVYKSLSNR